jgi:hypothetical protein
MRSAERAIDCRLQTIEPEDRARAGQRPKHGQGGGPSDAQRPAFGGSPERRRGQEPPQEEACQTDHDDPAGRADLPIGAVGMGAAGERGLLLGPRSEDRDPNILVGPGNLGLAPGGNVPLGEGGGDMIGFSPDCHGQNLK